MTMETTAVMAISTISVRAMPMIFRLMDRVNMKKLPPAGKAEGA
jgi:hypothetical protein